MKFGVNGGLKLPVGYRFYPTDEEVVEYYLKRKVFDLPLPASLIPEFDVFLTDPWGLPGDLKEKRFFFSKHNNFIKKNTGTGTWKFINGREKLISNGGNNQVLGLRKSLIFSEPKTNNSSKTSRWVMHEYRLACLAKTPNSTQSWKIEVGEWAIYCLFQKRKRGKKQVSRPQENKRLAVTEAIALDLTVEKDQFPHSSSSSSSVSSNCTESTDQEVSSFPSYSPSHVREA